MRTPVAFFIFNRPDTTNKVFQAIRQASPAKLLVVADGPRIDRAGEVEKCAATRAIIDQVDWNCDVLTNYSETNLGCEKRVSSGLDWVFSIVEEAIILEDDCVPHLTFFSFCEVLLDHYQNDERIVTVSGSNLQFGRRRTEDSYYFSRYKHCWGWATWRRAWQYYDAEMKLWPMIRDSDWLNDVLLDTETVKYWTKAFQSTYENQINSWAYRWTFACWLQSGLTVLPNVNLVSNIGYGAGATHTTNRSPLASMPVEAIIFPLQHPRFIIRDVQADHFTHENFFKVSLLNRFRGKAKHILGRTIPFLRVAISSNRAADQ